MKTLIISFVLVLASSLAFADKDFDEGKGARWDCKDDPIVNINHGSGTYTFVGACTLININGGSNTVTIEAVDDLNINAGNNKVTVGVVGNINIVGSSNHVTWKHAKDGDAPGGSIAGTGNKVGKAN